MIDSHSARQNIVVPMAFVVLSIVLMFIDRSASSNGKSPLKPAREIISYVLLDPIRKTIDIPFSVYSYVQSYLVSHNKLVDENKQLRQLTQIYSAREQKYRSILQENKRLRDLLQTEAMTTERFILANVITVDSNRFRQTVVVNKGSQNNVFEGQVAITGNSIYGQVISTTPTTSVIMQLTDPKHIIPVKNERTGTMALAVGTGEPNTLELTKTESTNDVHVGDVFLTSGLGQVFPPDFPVARVERVTYNPSDSFTTVRAKTIAQFSRTRELLLIWRDKDSDLLPPEGAIKKTKTKKPEGSQ